ncbi:MAG TPA: transglutaminase-like domain-containing protein [Phycisphaerae bacterium]|nr:transglutaminase-like domain-containing protein [Phycisphaerae bacterium]
MQTLIRAALLVILPAAAAHAAFDPNNPPQGLFDDNYYAIELQGQKCGYARIAVRREGNVIRSLNFTTIKIKRGPTPIEIIVKNVHRESLDGRVLGFESEQYTGLMTVKQEGIIHDGKLTLTTAQGGQTTTQTYDWNPDALLAWGSYLFMHRRGLHIGDRFELLTYDASVRPEGPIKAQIAVLAREPVELLGSKVEAFRVDTTLDLGMQLTSTSWLREDGVPLINTMELAFLKLRMLRCPKQFAMQDLAPPELLVSTLVRADRPVDGQAAKRIVFRLSLPSGSEPLDLPTTAMQRIVARGADSIDLEVRKVALPDAAPRRASPRDPALAPYLASTLYLKHDDPAILELAAQGCDGETDPSRIAPNLCRFVSREITTKDLSIGFATASEVAKTRQGDCSEHAVLLAALARACAIPSRVAVGIVHVEQALGRQDVFGYHMWTQVYLAGGWYDLDSALHQTECDPTHIALDISDLADATLTNLALRLLPVIGQLKIQVLSVD